MDNNYISFRKAKVGGFNKKDVISYIEKMRNDFYDYKKAVEATVESLNAKINELEALNNSFNADAEAEESKDTVCEAKSGDPIYDINASAVRLRMVADELCRNLTDFMGTVAVEALACEQTECECAECEGSEDDSEEAVIKTDKAAEILARSFGFSFQSDAKSDKILTEAPAVKERKSVLDSLSSSAFFY